jgi:hypothetical protein
MTTTFFSTLKLSIRVTRHAEFFSIEKCTKKKVERSGSRILSPVTGALTIYRDYIDWRWPLSLVHLVMMVFLAQIAEGGGSRLPTLFHSIYHLHLSYVAPSTLSP